MDGIILLRAGRGGAHHFSGWQAVNHAVRLGDGGADSGVFVQDRAQVRHDIGGKVRRQIEERPAVSVPPDIVIREADRLERVRQVAAGNADVDLFAKGVRHGFPVDFDTRLLHQFIEHRVVVIAGGQRRDAADNMEFGLLGVFIDRAVVRVFPGPARAAAQQQRGGKREGNGVFHAFPHNNAPFLS